MDARSEIREFLTSRRARITPEQAGLSTYGTGPRRVPGLRREEVALLAGVSVAYYTKLERGDTSGVSETVLDSLARTLQLDDAERAHLFDLARPQRTSARKRRRRGRQQVRPSVPRILDAMKDVPAARSGTRGSPSLHPREHATSVRFRLRGTANSWINRVGHRPANPASVPRCEQPSCTAPATSVSMMSPMPT